MSPKRLGIVLMLVGVALAATGTFGAGVIDADRVSRVSAVADDPNDEDGNYFDTGDATDGFTTIEHTSTTVWYAFNHFHEPLSATRIEVVDVRPENASANATTTNDSAVVVATGANVFDAGDTLRVSEKGGIALKCNPAFNQTVDADHRLTVRLEVVGTETDTRFALERTVTESVECNAR